MKAKLMFVHALSPLHAGTGQGVGVIDLPIAREKATGLPYLPGSSVKGVLRDQSFDTDKDQCEKVFGPDTVNADAYAGSAQFADQRLLLLPIRSLRGTFAWVTSPYLLRRLARDAQDVELTNPLPQSVPEPADEMRCLVSAANDIQMVLDNKNKVILEDLDLQVAGQPTADDWAEWLAKHVFPENTAWQTYLKARLCIVHDDALSFLLETATEVTARIKLKDDTKTVQKGGLWYEEALPSETVLSGLVVATPTKKFSLKPDDIFDTIDKLLKHPLQFGGNATVGRGLCRVRLG